MVRTQIQLTEAQARALKRLAAERGVSIAALIREAVDRLVHGGDPDAVWRRALAVIGRYSAGPGNVSEDHDRHLEEAYFDWRSS